MNLIKWQFKQKKRYADLVLFLQILILIIIAIWTIFNKDSNGYYNAFNSGAYPHYWRAIFESNVSLVIFADITFGALSCWANEKINLSQTWNLIPVTTNKLWLGNIFSSILTCVYLFVLQMIFLFITCLAALPDFIDKNPIKHVLGAFGLWPNLYTTRNVFETIIFLFLIAYFVYIFVSFINFSSRAIVDYLPVKNILWVRMLVMAIISIIGIYISSIFVGHISNFVQSQYDKNSLLANRYSDPMWLSNLITVIVDALISIVDLGLFNKYVESK